MKILLKFLTIMHYLFFLINIWNYKELITLIMSIVISDQ